MEIIEYHASKGVGSQGYFKVTARSIANGNVFGANDESGGGDDQEQPSYLLRR